MEVSASKVESMFVEIQRKYAEFAKSKDMVADMGKSLNGIEREMASIRAMSSQFSSKIELNNLRKAVEGQVKWIKGITKDSRQFRDFFQKINYLETEQKAIKASIERANANFIRFSGEFDRFSNFISVKTRELEVKWLETERIKASIYEMIEDTKKAFDGKIDAVMDVIEDFAEGAEGADRLGYGKPPVQAVQAVQAYPQYRAGRTSSLIRLRDYIWECMAKGYSIETIEKVLRNAGYREDEITAAISGLR
jgi:archaellum component FlaC